MPFRYLNLCFVVVGSCVWCSCYRKSSHSVHYLSRHAEAYLDSYHVLGCTSCAPSFFVLSSQLVDALVACSSLDSLSISTAAAIIGSYHIAVQLVNTANSPLSFIFSMPFDVRVLNCFGTLFCWVTHHGLNNHYSQHFCAPMSFCFCSVYCLMESAFSYLMFWSEPAHDLSYRYRHYRQTHLQHTHYRGRSCDAQLILASISFKSNSTSMLSAHFYSAYLSLNSEMF